MHTHRFARVDELVRGCFRLDPDSRGPWLDEQCGGDTDLRDEVLALLAEDDRTDGLLDQPALGEDLRLSRFVPGSRADPPPGSDAGPPVQVGRYRIIRKLGEGGMGVVYEAEQDRPQRTVALKLITAGPARPEVLQRFEHETQVLGRLQHPGIAQIYEAGTFHYGGEHGGCPRPFFAMELVRGKPLTRYATVNDLDLARRLELVARICEAVQHAHLKGVIHRDLKPSNIIVDDWGQPKILDFGVARVTDADVQALTVRTTMGQLVGTVPYMSPEQAAGDPDELDTRSDVYALGVVAYELLTGRLPYDIREKMVHEAVRVIREDDPVPPGSVDRLLRGDLDTILRKALEKDKSHRYQSALAFGSDIRRYLRDEPVAARPPSAWYQLRKFAKRNRAAVASAAALLIMLVTAFALVSVALARSRAAERTANSERARAEQVAVFLGELFQLERLFDVPEAGAARGRSIDAGEILDRGAERVLSELEDQPQVQAMLLQTIGDAYRSLSFFDRARPLLRQALALRRTEHGDVHERVASCLSSLGRLALEEGDYPEAETLMADAVRQRRALHESPHPDLAAALGDLALVLQQRRLYGEAEAAQREALDMLRRLHGEAHVDVARGLDLLGRLMRSRGDYDDAESNLRAALAMKRALLGRDDPGVAATMSHLALLLQDREAYDEAERILLEVVATTRRLLGDVHPDLAISLNNLGILYKDMRRHPEAEARLRDALDMFRELYGEAHPQVARTMDNLARVRRRQGDYAEAEALHRQALELRRRLLDPGHPSIANSLSNLALVVQRDRPEEAEMLYRESLAIYRDLDDLDADLPTVLHNLALLLADRNQPAEAAPLFRESVDLNRRIRGATDWRVATDLSHLAGALVALGEMAPAETALLELYEIRRASDDERTGDAGDAVERLVRLYEAWARPEKAETWKRKLKAES